MSAKDIYHDTVRKALIKAGWTITDDPLLLPIGARSTYIDLGAEKLIAAQRDTQKIAVEVKSFISPSLISDLEKPGDNSSCTPESFKSLSQIVNCT